MKSVVEIERIVRKGISSLEKSLAVETPLPLEDEANEISEGNLSIHIAHAFIASKYVAFSEYRIGNSEHHDLVFRKPRSKVYVVVECKRFLKTDNTGASLDIERVIDVWGTKSAVGVLVAMTRDPPILPRERPRGGAVLAPATLAGVPAQQRRQRQASVWHAA